MAFNCGSNLKKSLMIDHKHGEAATEKYVVKNANHLAESETSHLIKMAHEIAFKMFEKKIKIHLHLKKSEPKEQIAT